MNALRRSFGIPAPGKPVGEPGRTPKHTKPLSMAGAGYSYQPVTAALRPTSFLVLFGAAVLGILCGNAFTVAVLIAGGWL